VDGRLLVVEDDPQVRAMLLRALGYEGFDVRGAADGAGALAELRARGADLVLLDLLLPDMDGMEVCRMLRAQGAEVPILMLTARDGVDNRIAGLETGADDYVVKPFSTQELVARVRSLLRRAREAGEGEERRFADLVVVPARREVHRGARPVELTPREFALLEAFLRQPRTVLGRERLLAEAWGADAVVETNVVDVYVGYLRRKLEEAGEARLVWTVRGAGWILREGAPR
jgi:two-component system response regulator MprA